MQLAHASAFTQFVPGKDRGNVFDNLHEYMTKINGRTIGSVIIPDINLSKEIAGKHLITNFLCKADNMVIPRHTTPADLKHLKDNARKEAAIRFAIFINTWRQKLQQYLPESTIHKYFRERSGLPNPLTLKGLPTAGDEGNVELSGSQRNWLNESSNFSRLRTRSDDNGESTSFDTSHDIGCFHCFILFFPFESDCDNRESDENDSLPHTRRSHSTDGGVSSYRSARRSFPRSNDGIVSISYLKRIDYLIDWHYV